MHLLTLAFGVAVSAAALEKRCSPRPDPEYYGGYYRVPCWLSLLPNCATYIPSGVTLALDVETRSATITPISPYCVALIAEEHARELDGRKVWGWSESEGTLDTSQEGVLVITNMSDGAITRYQRYQNGGLGY